MIDNNFRMSFPIDEYVPSLEPGIYETCPLCLGRGKGCRECWDEGLIAHQHTEDEDSDEERDVFA